MKLAVCIVVICAFLVFLRQLPSLTLHCSAALVNRKLARIWCLGEEDQLAERNFLEFQDSSYQRDQEMAARIVDGDVYIQLDTTNFDFRIGEYLGAFPNIRRFYDELMSGRWTRLPSPSSARGRQVSIDHGSVMVVDDRDHIWYLKLFVILEDEMKMMPENYYRPGNVQRREKWQARGSPKKDAERPPAGQARYLAFGIISWDFMGSMPETTLDWVFSRIGFAGEWVSRGSGGTMMTKLFKVPRDVFVGPYQGDAIHCGIAMHCFLEQGGRSLMLKDVAYAGAPLPRGKSIGAGLSYRLYIPDGIGMKLDYANTILAVLAARFDGGQGLWVAKSDNDWHGYSPVPSRKVAFENSERHSAPKWRWIDLPVESSKLSTLFRCGYMNPRFTGDSYADEFSICIGDVTGRGYWKFAGKWTYVEDPRAFRFTDPRRESVQDLAEKHRGDLEEAERRKGKDLPGFLQVGGRTVTAQLLNWRKEANKWTILDEDGVSHDLHASPDSWALLFDWVPKRWDLACPTHARRVRVKEGETCVKILDYSDRTFVGRFSKQ